MKTAVLVLWVTLVGNQTASAAMLLGSFGGHDYYLSDDLLSLAGGRLAANQLGIELGRNAYLAAITSQEEQDALKSMLEALPVFPEVRIGLSDELVEGVFLWDSGEPVDFTFWIDGEPNDNPFPYGEEDSVLFNVFFGTRWNDFGTPAERTALIEVAEVVPEPSSLILAAVGACILAGLCARRKPTTVEHRGS